MTIMLAQPAARRVITPADVALLIDRRWGGLSLLQCAVLYVVGFHAEEDGVFRLPASKIVHFIGQGSETRCAAIPRELVEYGLLDEVGGRAGVRHWQLTRLGHAVFRELIGERGD